MTTFRAIFIAVVIATVLLVGAFLVHQLEAAAPLVDRILYGAPPFAPLLFTDLALLGALAAWDLRAREPLNVAP